jgi:hypothetical protein
MRQREERKEDGKQRRRRDGKAFILPDFLKIAISPVHHGGASYILDQSEDRPGGHGLAQIELFLVLNR